MWLKYWFEISYSDLFIKQKPYNKGGDYRKWYGNNEYVIMWADNGKRIKSYQRSGNINDELYFRKCITWNLVTSYKPSFRAIIDEDHIMGDAGPVTLVKSDEMLYILGILNSKYVEKVAELIAPTINFTNGVAGKIPIIINKNFQDKVSIYVDDNITKSKSNWDSFEISWDFLMHPFLGCGKKAPYLTQKISCTYAQFKETCEKRFKTLKRNEEELNRIFIDIYGLVDELTPEVADKDVTVARIYDTKAEIPESMKGNNYVLTKADVIKSFISYAVGCMMGRYSIYKEGLFYAGGPGGDLGSLAGKIQDALHAEGKSRFPEPEFYPDKDAILPICEDEYFEDDIVNLFVKFVSVVYGEDMLAENLQFIAAALGGKGTPREVLRSYFLNDFYKDHCKTYQKRPIYWLFDAGKKNSFKALVYLHRYRPDTIARLRTDYVHEQQERYHTAIAQLEAAIDKAASTAESVRLKKKLKKFTEQAAELHDYEEKVHHLADQMISIDLDDGVKKNYAIFQDILAKIK